MVVQGPPGNGKSLTIANLVAHLVAQGPARPRLQPQEAGPDGRPRQARIDTGQRFLFASLIGDGAAAKRELQSQIADVKRLRRARPTAGRSIASSARSKGAGQPTARLRASCAPTSSTAPSPSKRGRRAPSRLRRTLPSCPCDQALREPLAASRRRRAAPARRAGSRARAVWGAAARHLGGRRPTIYRARDARSASSSPSQRARIVAAATIRPSASSSPPGTRSTPTPPRSTRPGGPAGDPVRRFWRVSSTARRSTRPGCASPTRRICWLTSSEVAATSETAFAEAALPSAAPRRRRGRPGAARAGPSSSTRCSAFYDEAPQRPQWLDENAPGRRRPRTDAGRRLGGFWDWWSGVRTHCRRSRRRPARRRARALRPGRRPGRTGPRRRAPPREPARSSPPAKRRVLQRPAAAAEGALDAQAGGPRRVKAAERRCAPSQADRDGNALKGAEELASSRGTPTARRSARPGRLRRGRRLRRPPRRGTARRCPPCRSAARLLDGPLAQLPARRARKSRRPPNGASTPPPSWSGSSAHWRSTPTSVAVQRDRRRPQTPTTSPTSCRSWPSEVMEDARPAARRCGSRQRILDGFRKPSFLASLEASVRRSAPRPNASSASRSSRTPRTSTSTSSPTCSPAGSCDPRTPAASSRCAPDVFDVLIVDEASQCNPDQVLPLFARASRVVIVGDDKQLSNEDLRRIALRRTPTRRCSARPSSTSSTLRASSTRLATACSSLPRSASRQSCAQRALPLPPRDIAFSNAPLLRQHPDGHPRPRGRPRPRPRADHA